MKIVYTIILFTLCMMIFSVSSARDFFILGVPEPVTVTTTDMVLNNYTQLLDSDVSHSKFYITNLDASQSVTITYNSLTYTVVDDYTTIAAGATIERDGQVPDGVYCGVTDTSGPVSVSVKFESWK